MTNSMCATHCCAFLNDATFMGTENRKECYCSNATNNATFVESESTDCNTLCVGNSNEFCGARFRLSLYRIECTPDTTVTGCPPTFVNRSTIIPEVTTKSNVTAQSPSTINVNGIQIDNTIMTEEELTEKLAVLRDAISIDKKDTYMYKTTKMSAYDPRKSSRNIGIVGVIVLFAPVIFVVVIDAHRICH
ncbi:Hypothetical predicted protein [Mytilus galloprovincialis]|uniref:WSC domain-containing protein n=1 Tax=Mytilus galloprovincialis TaxID=29158 RepID=A0A8B6F1H6_MYTGA|nr:Hypothetical predicted protein [Mytilus galloprovincialis]